MVESSVFDTDVVVVFLRRGGARMAVWLRMKGSWTFYV